MSEHLFYFLSRMQTTLEIGLKNNFKTILMLQMFITWNHYVHKHFVIWFNLWLLNKIVLNSIRNRFSTLFAYKCTNWFQSLRRIAQLFLLLIISKSSIAIKSMNIVSDYTGNQRMPQSLFQYQFDFSCALPLSFSISNYFNENDSEIYCYLKYKSIWMCWLLSDGRNAWSFLTNQLQADLAKVFQWKLLFYCQWFYWL